MNAFGEYLKELRGDRSLREMERVTGLSHTYLSTLEKGFDPRSGKERKPTPDAIKELSRGLSQHDDKEFLQLYNELMRKAGYSIDWSAYDEVHQDSTSKYLDTIMSPDFVKETYNHNIQIPIYLDSNNQGNFYFINDNGKLPEEIQKKLKLMIKTFLD